MRLYAIGDIHGQLDMLKAAHGRIAADRARTGDRSAPVVHLGDFMDRGPDSAGVVQALIDGIADGQPWHAIKGNHDRLFTGFMADHSWEDPYLAGRLSWFDPRLGGAETLASYGVANAGSRPVADVHAEADRAVPQAHRDFLENLPLCHETSDLFLVHAGIRPGIAFSDQDEEDMIWIRDGFLDDDTDHGKLIVHGHTALEEATHFGNRVDLDTGAGYFRPLSVAVFEDRKAWLLTDAGREDLFDPTRQG